MTLNSRSLVLTLLGLLAALPANVFAQDGSSSRSIPAAELETFVDDLIGQAMSGHRVAGVAVSIVQNGQVVLNKGYGVASLSPARAVDPDTTLFHIGSITKTFTSILLMREVEAGRISLDDPVNQHLPASLQIPHEGFSKPIRVRDLMTHQPGFEDTALGHLFVLDASRIRPLSLYLQQERPRRVREPGALSSYSNYGFALAGAVLEHVSGKSWQELVELKLLHPLGVTQMTAREFYPPRSDLPSPMPAELASHLSGAFRRRSTGFIQQPLEYATHIAPAGAMSASAGAMARYMLMLLNDGTLDGATLFNLESAKVFRRPMTNNAPEVGNWAGGFRDRLLQPYGIHAYGHEGSTFTHYSSLALLPDLKLGVFIVANTGGAGFLTENFSRQVLAHFYPATKPRPGGSQTVASNAALYRGEYLKTRRAYGGLEGFFQSLIGSPVEVTRDGFLIVGGTRLAPLPGNEVFAAAGGSGDGAAVEMERGRVRRILLPSFALEPLGFWSRPSTFQAVALLTVLAAIAVFLRWPLRRLSPLPESGPQARARRLRQLTAALWLLCFGLMGVWAARSVVDPTYAIYHWPSPFVLGGSAAALLASLCTAGLIVLLPVTLKAGPAAFDWGLWRRLRYLCSVLVFATCAVVMAIKGALALQ